MPDDEEITYAPFACTCTNSACKNYRRVYITELPTNYPNSVICGPCGQGITPAAVNELPPEEEPPAEAPAEAEPEVEQEAPPAADGDVSEPIEESAKSKPRQGRAHRSA